MSYSVTSFSCPPVFSVSLNGITIYLLFKSRHSRLNVTLSHPQLKSAIISGLVHASISVEWLLCYCLHPYSSSLLDLIIFPHIAIKFTILRSKTASVFKKSNSLSHRTKSKLFIFSQYDSYFPLKYPATNLVTLLCFRPN